MILKLIHSEPAKKKVVDIEYLKTCGLFCGKEYNWSLLLQIVKHQKKGELSYSDIDKINERYDELNTLYGVRK